MLDQFIVVTFFFALILGYLSGRVLFDRTSGDRIFLYAVVAVVMLFIHLLLTPNPTPEIMREMQKWAVIAMFLGLALGALRSKYVRN